MIKVLVSGFRGAMGAKAVKMITADPDLKLVSVYSPNVDPQDGAKYDLPSDCKIFNHLDEIEPDAQVWVDFSTPDGAFENAKFALEHHMVPIIGTSGLSDQAVSELQKIAQQNQMNGLIVPNFGLSAVLLMQFAKQAAKYFPDAEIIEMHHADKADSPSGTAINTAKLIVEGREADGQKNEKEIETMPDARGADYEGVHIHAVRLPGYVAHEQVLFGGAGEALTIRQDSFDRESFMHGLNIAIKNVDKLDGFAVGLENVL
ncbi:4-hydroxy-tetrahydrodipicolinate reductase [Fructilactobacillus lindneri]|uniref:4-hydroxy-tetrahydrodipicolinate reductase n=2 Tax=Fructilactobacillus lindneri TaxID=53444 RepID=A0A0R2JSN8_9LACO|nr:4-hydroxy-tetrahydrodipicolinate reductase [Fructilactobacillus lindneri]ANZ57669.1 4-hydroxy-tetrahydrodipicolinate reductase [Fructilactobacillus lindneri]ANZ58939.1 4-hydroxy-tetrahydrodipicolinate reductase [Fructilactobacillus lindneri]KRN78405.1 dihydrodipicolinate reductase [Fructilactobacillus lindneri DSM 20690 = JCM 11027]POG97966.1 4-hydroxy-tetrahydrodipicolinate reductase [Fructilactobacillus lindneri]POG99018.1 4-hydroxy-tetrahydrodipicolinate reductase [Fructilactobacillus li